ncbi:phytoene/squalene synthase family protein [Enterococcus sp. 669A]|uniref:Phytoene/squalene synthase family protein n=1 Tax=Candidatus Enterococcus moelleringii TaxID=2815325 RepID=A0ABS3LGD2_9ENTE|nr:phytoene/squalene synthase family protein [Enterococcus sp. 669A]MBO1307756.1 phytoene/squalene synthase family protein [Enterococcus sp. 669A]
MTNKLATDFIRHQADFDYCERIIEHHSKSFYAAFSRLPEQKAMSVYAIYAFCRRADDAIDVEKNPEKLAELKAQLGAFQKGDHPDEPLWRALAVVFKHYPLDIQAFYDMLEGQRRDIKFQQPATQQELEEYSYYVAGSVGLMLLPLLSQNWEKIIEEAKQLGEAMQITNILRDIGEDEAQGRIYLPKDKMAEYGVTPEDLKQHRQTAEFAQLWEYEAQRAEASYQKGLTMMPWIDEDCRTPLLAACYFYREILEVVRENDYQVFTQKHAVKQARKLRIFQAIRKELAKIDQQKESVRR